jgi:hypothetical protein
MAKDPDDRWATAEEFVDRLGEAMTPPPPKRGAAAAGTTATRKLDRTPPPPSRPARPAAAAGAPRKSGPGSGTLLAVLAAALLVLVVGFLLLRGDGEGNRTAADRTPTPTATAEKKDTPTPTSTPEDTPEPTPTATPEETPAPQAKKPKGSANQLQVQAFNLNNEGQYEQALPIAQAAVEKGCKGNAPVNPCGYALYELGRAQRGTGDPQSAIQTLEQRLERYPDDQRSTVEAELRRARQDAGE